LSDYGTLAFEVKSSFAKHLESSAYEELQELLKIPEQIGLLKFLEQHPLNGLYFANDILVNAREVNGAYLFSTQEASINLTRTSKDFGQVYQKQQFWSISTLASNQHSAIQRTFVHELGHHIHQTLRRLDLSLFRFTMMIPMSDSISHYGLGNPLEHFAESFAAYVFQRAELVVDDSFGYAMIRKVLERFELELKELP
jgi:hypothetical protein